MSEASLSDQLQHEELDKQCTAILKEQNDFLDAAIKKADVALKRLVCWKSHYSLFADVIEELCPATSGGFWATS